VKNAPSKFTFITRRHSAVVISTEDLAYPPTPALAKPRIDLAKGIQGFSKYILDSCFDGDVAL